MLPADMRRVRLQMTDLGTKTWAFLLGLVAMVGVMAAFATGNGDEAANKTADNVFPGELGLAERMGIWRNQYRRGRFPSPWKSNLRKKRLQGAGGGG